MRKKTAGVLFAATAGGLLLTGVVAATSHSAGHVSVHASRVAYTTTSVSTQGGPGCLNQATTGHCYAITEYTPPAGTVGAHLTFPFLPINTGGSSLGNGDYHVNNTLWAIFPGDNNYIEAGVAD